MKIGFLITARLKSSRLPLKLLLDVQGKTLVERVIDRTKQLAYVSDIILCTSTNSQDRPLVDIAIKNDIYYYLGSEDDVLQRLRDAALFFECDYFINITGENPLFSVEYANRMVDALRTGKYDFSYIEGLPIGCAVYGLSTKAVSVACQVKEVIDTEFWGSLVNRPDIFSVHKIVADKIDQFPETIRITSDYKEDYLMIAEIFKHFPLNDTPSYMEMLNLIKKHPEIKEINAMHQQLAPDDALEEKIKAFYDKNKEKVIELLGR